MLRLDGWRGTRRATYIVGWGGVQILDVFLEFFFPTPPHYSYCRAGVGADYWWETIVPIAQPLLKFPSAITFTLLRCPTIL